ncbi:nuclear/nucleolar GTPase 2-like [Silene latifolia]|uniref:nuclear/nucleolar GTPase 2-like n=1 Tax=Silene latifolia TaxID=37657 RepID=UPI003D774600
MQKKREIKRPKHSLHANRSNVVGKNSNRRTAATVRRLKMYNSRPTRNVRGRVIRVAFKSKELPCTRIQSDRRWFTPTRLIGQKQLECFREDMESRMSNNYNVILGEKKLPMSLLNNLPKQKRAQLLDTQPVDSEFVPSKKTNVELTKFQALLQKVDTSKDVFEQTVSAKPSSWSELHKVIDSSDVVIQVLDARDPQGTRCYHLEKHLKEKCKHKHMILLLNKCDLIPAWATKGWITTLSKEYPTLAFSADTNKPFGKDSLISVLQQFATLKSDKQAVSIGFVGYPNVGKSSVISALNTKNICKVLPTQTEGKVLQYITLTERILLLDCPGGVYPCSDSNTDVLFKGTIRVENLRDAAEHTAEVLKRVKKEHLERAYKIKDWEDENDFLVKLCNQLEGGLLKGGEPDLMKAAKTVITDLQSGKIPFFVPPVKQDDA